MTWLSRGRSARSYALAFGLCALFACGDADGRPMPDGQDASHDASDASNGASDAALDSGRDASEVDDASEPDAALDAGSDAGDASAPLSPPMSLLETGLYAEGSTSDLANGVMPYTPRYALWSDGAEKARYLLLPEGETIDTSDVDAFVFPVGTKAWKEFSHDGVHLETRLLWKTEAGWIQVAYAWNEAQDDALATTRGALDVLGTAHDIPPRSECRECHDGAADTLLGVSAVQLAHAGDGLTLAKLHADGRLSSAPPDSLERPDTLEWNALGYLHANCGTCHNPRGTGFTRVNIELWLRAEDVAVTSTRTYETCVGVATEKTTGDDITRIEAGSPDDSALFTRIKLRGTEAAMPPIASERTDDAGVALIEAWIESL